MPKRPRFTPSEIEHDERLMAEVESRRASGFSEDVVQHLLADMQSADEQTRARAVRELCPCRMPWEVFDRLRSAAKRLQRDPSPLVRAEARHIEQDAREVASTEARAEHYQEYLEKEEELRSIRRRTPRRGVRK
jgi:hypothetical protein